MRKVHDELVMQRNKSRMSFRVVETLASWLALRRKYSARLKAGGRARIWCAYAQSQPAILWGKSTYHLDVGAVLMSQRYVSITKTWIPNSLENSQQVCRHEKVSTGSP
jgi:lauroyl/myristoyl acyltransferase